MTLLVVCCILCGSVLAYKESYLEILNTIVSLVGIILIPILIYYFGSIIVRREDEQQKQIALMCYIIVELELLNESLVRFIKLITARKSVYMGSLKKGEMLNYDNNALSYEDTNPIPKIYLEMEMKELQALSVYAFDAYKNVMILRNKILDVNNRIEDFNELRLIKGILRRLKSSGKTISKDILDSLNIAIKIGDLEGIKNDIKAIQSLLIEGILIPICKTSEKIGNSRLNQICVGEFLNLTKESNKK